MRALPDLLTVTPHAHGQAFLQAAILTTITVVLGDFAVLVSPTLIAQLFADGPFEEAFASFATDGSVMSAFKERMTTISISAAD